MCLTLKKIKIAKRDIVCYKIVYKTEYGYKSYYCNYTFTDELRAQDPFPHYIQKDTYLTSQIVHAFKRKFRAESDIIGLGILSPTNDDPLVIIKCIIPKGYVYVIGDDGDIGSSFMKVIGEI